MPVNLPVSAPAPEVAQQVRPPEPPVQAEQQPQGHDFASRLDGAAAMHADSAATGAVQAARAKVVQPAEQRDMLSLDMFKQQQGLRAEARQVFEQMRDGKLHGVEAMGRLMDLQMRAQEVSFRLELASKVIEHGTTGARTMLQTQA